MSDQEGGAAEMLRRSPLRSLAKSLTAAETAAGSSLSSHAPAPPASASDEQPLRTKNKTVFFTSEICELHDVPDHPESLQRTQVIRERVLRDFPSIDVVRDIQLVTRDQLVRFHTEKHVDEITRLFGNVATRFNRPGHDGRSVMVSIDGDTSIMEGTEQAAMVAAGAVCHAIDLVMSDTSSFTNAFCGVRPPGHHAEPQRAMGFCLFNNIGVGACHLLHAYRDQIQRVLILDFDVHHGNGTQAKFSTSDSEQVCFVSTHQGQFYPFTGLASERGMHDNILNVPLRPRTGSKAYRSHFETHVLPAMHAFKPEFILISAGFDAHRLDPLADIALETDDYYWITKHATDIAWEYAQGRIVSSLEGGNVNYCYGLKDNRSLTQRLGFLIAGYHLEALAASAAAHVRALVEGAVPPKRRDERNETGAEQDVDQLTTAFAASVTLDAPV
jgi:acetoin utilization deacetylase AcuC-like enzyme